MAKRQVQTVDVEVVTDEDESQRESGFDPLSPSESALKQELESIVSGAVWNAGFALQQLRDKRLYRDTHSSFSQYCRERFGHSRQKSDYLIAGANIYENLTSNRCQILPTTEYQVRPLGVLEPLIQVQAWEEAVAIASEKVPSHQIVKKVVRQLTRQPGANSFELGEVVGIISKDNPQLRGKNGCWAVVTAISSDTCDIKLWDSEIEAVDIEYLKELDYTEEDCESIRKLQGRIERLQQSKELEATAKGILGLLGKIERPYLTPLEEEMLKVLEQAYG